MKKVLFALLALLTMISVNAQNVTRPGSVRAENGILYLPEGSNFLEEANKIANMSEAEFTAFEQKVGYKSLRTKISAGLDAVENDENGKNRAAIKQRFGNILMFGTNDVKPFVESPLYAAIANESGIYGIGKSLIKITNDNKIIIIKDGSLSKLKMAETRPQDDANEGITVHTRNVAMRTANCDNQTSQTSVDGKRRATIKIGVDVCYIGCQSGCNLKVYYVYVKVFGEIKRPLLNVFDPYKTELAFSQVGFEIINSFGNTITMNNLSANSSGDVRSLYRMYYIDPQPNLNPVNIPTDCSFTKVKGKGHSRGLGSTRFAILCTGFPNTDCPQ